MNTLLARHPWICFAVVVVLSGLAATQLGRSQTRYEIEDFFPRGTDEYRVYERASELFGRDDRTAAIVVQSESALELSQWEALRDLVDELGGCELLSDVLSATHVELPLRDPQGGVRLQPAFAPGPLGEARLAAVLAALDRPLFREALVSLDRRVTLIACRLKSEHTDFGGRAELLDLLRERTQSLAESGLRVHLGGYPLQRVELSRLAGGESATFLPWALGLILLTLALTLRGLAAWSCRC